MVQSACLLVLSMLVVRKEHPTTLAPTCTGLQQERMARSCCAAIPLERSPTLSTEMENLPTSLPSRLTKMETNCGAGK